MSDVLAPDSGSPGTAPVVGLGTATPSGPPLSPAERRAKVLEKAGLFAAPVGIVLVAVLLYLYVQNLDLANANRQQRSAIDWGVKLWPQTRTHLEIAMYSTLLVIVVAVPLGVALTRPAMRRLAAPILAIANTGQALPAYGLLAVSLVIFGQGRLAVIYALAFFALLPVLRNTMVGLQAVDRALLEAGRGMGMTRIGVLTRLELPLAVPIIVAGVRTAMVINIGMATLAFAIGGGGLGITINSGLKLNQNPVLIVGAVLVAIIAVTFDWLGAMAERYLKPRGI